MAPSIVRPAARSGRAARAVHGAGPAKGPRLPRAERERQILAVAEQLFIERGYAAASMDELARRVGVSKPVIYDLVGGKEQLFRSAVERAGDDLTQRVLNAWATGRTLEDRFRAGALAFFQFVDDHRSAWAMLLSPGAAPETAEPVDLTRRRQVELMQGMLVDASSDTLGDERAEALAHALTGAFESAATWWPQPKGPSPDEMADMVCDLLLPGLERELQSGV